MSKKTEEEIKLTNKQRRFVEEYLIDLNATQAAIRAGYSEKTAGQIGEQNLKKLEIKKIIDRRLAELTTAAEIKQEDVLKRYRDIAFADPNQLSEYRRVPCRYCYGTNHQYQWRTEFEFDDALEKAQAKIDAGKNVRLPNDNGGYGYTTKQKPHPDCPMCDGEGIGRLVLKDTRDLPENVRALYAGTKYTKDGIVIEMHDQLAALNNIGKHLGMFREKIDVNLGVEADVLDRLANIQEASRLRSLELANKLKARQYTHTEDEK